MTSGVKENSSGTTLLIEQVTLQEQEIKSPQALLQGIANADPLTGLLGRSEMEWLLEREIQRMGRQENIFSFALLDVDRLELINNSHGHGAGDAVLRRLAQTLRGIVRETDYVARWEDDAFAVLLPETHYSGAKAFADRLRLVLRNGQTTPSLPPVTISAGVISVCKKSLGLPVLLECAVKVLYAAKNAGRDRANFLVLDEETNWVE
jgi:diguanylate cyclase (GGDEF)-like protein